MLTIYKYQFEIKDDIVIEMPEISDILSIQVQDGMPTMWARVDTNSKTFRRHFIVLGTGHEVRLTLPYRGTIQLDGLVWHIFG
jgi:hypothetical protein